VGDSYVAERHDTQWQEVRDDEPDDVFDFLHSLAAMHAVWQAPAVHNVGRDTFHRDLECRDRQPDEDDCTNQQALLHACLYKPHQNPGTAYFHCFPSKK